VTSMVIKPKVNSVVGSHIRMYGCSNVAGRLKETPVSTVRTFRTPVLSQEDGNYCIRPSNRKLKRNARSRGLDCG
jgi:hypothetical protein